MISVIVVDSWLFAATCLLSAVGSVSAAGFLFGSIVAAAASAVWVLF